VPMSGQMRYPGMQAYSPMYGEGMEAIPHFGYSQHRPSQEPHGGMQHSPQQLLQLQQQQYEMQQRQMQQMHAFHEQQERHRPMMPRQMQPPQVVIPGVLAPSGSFDTSGAEFPALQGGVPGSSNPLVVPVSMQRAASGQPEGYGATPPTTASISNLGQGTTSDTMAAAAAAAGDSERRYVDTSRQHGDSAPPGRDTTKETTTKTEKEQQQQQQVPATQPHPPKAGAWGGQGRYEQPQPPPDEGMMSSPGRMNPQATVFAPSFGKTQGQQVQSTYTYVPYDPNQARPIYALSSQQPLYTQNIVYVPIPGANPGSSAEHSRGTTTAPPTTHQSTEEEDKDRATDSASK